MADIDDELKSFMRMVRDFLPTLATKADVERLDAKIDAVDAKVDAVRNDFNSRIDRVEATQAVMADDVRELRRASEVSELRGRVDEISRHLPTMLAYPGPNKH